MLYKVRSCTFSEMFALIFELKKVQSGPVEDLFGEYSGRWCILENTNLFCYSDNTCTHLREHIQASNILSIQVVQDAKYKYRQELFKLT